VACAKSVTPAERTAVGAHLIAGVPSQEGDDGFFAIEPATGRQRTLRFTEATPNEVDLAVRAAAAATRAARELTDQDRAELLDAAATALEDLGDELLTVAEAETGLPRARLESERVRTTEQLRGFAALLRAGWYVEAVIDTADPTARPLPRPDVRRMLVPLGPVAVFGASNFPLAFSVPGGDTASALAAGCPVVVKGHPCHPETSELCAIALTSAVRQVGAPAGMFSFVQGRHHTTGARLVTHPDLAAVGFTGSEAGGRALFNLAARRPEPIPVFAEMGSVNPLMVSEGALHARAETIAGGLVDSFLLGAGQFCTKPGLVLVPTTAAGDHFAARVVELATARQPQPMLAGHIRQALREHLDAIARIGGSIEVHHGPGDGTGIRQAAAVVTTDAAAVLAHQAVLLAEHFGPVCILVRYRSDQELHAVLSGLRGTLTATVHAEPDEHEWVRELLPVLVEKAGRVIFNGFPTGVSVTGAMNHTGPFPASTAPAHTSVGWTAIRRFLRPVAFQNFPAELLPPMLRDENPRRITRLVNDEFSSASVQEKTAPPRAEETDNAERR
jgi:NADP-dependent aldehyde dehydrogenase